MCKEISYCPKKMREFSKQDGLLCFVLKDMQSNGHKEIDALQIVFNSYVLDDSAMRTIYKSLKGEE